MQKPESAPYHRDGVEKLKEYRARIKELEAAGVTAP
jgi:hypothetical protein